MEVRFEATLEDFVDVCLRSIEHSKGHASTNRNGWIITTIFVGLIVSAIVPSTFGVRVIFGAMSSLLIALMYPYLYQKCLEKMVRNYCQEQIGSDKSFLVEVELNPQGLVYKQLKTQVIYDWSIVQDIQVTNDRIDFIFQDGGITTVRTRAFETVEQKERFIELADHYCNNHSISS